MLGVVADARLRGQLIGARQADTCLPAVQQEEALDLLGQFVHDYLPALAPAAIRTHP
jgi:hypothetical protein